MIRQFVRPVILSILTSFLLTHPAFSQVSVLQGHNDSQRTGQNTQETLLTPASVGSGNFQKLYTLTLPSQYSSVVAQPLYIPAVQINGASHNVLLVTNARAEVYAFDADTSAQLWFVTLLDAAHGAGPDAPNSLSNLPCSANTTTIRYGVYGTPVVDASTLTIYLISRSWESGATVQRIHALDLTTGNEKFGGPVVIQATISGSGWGSDGNGNLSFDPYSSFQRSGLVELNGVVYTAFGSFCEPYAPGWHGWIMGYNAATLQQTGAWSTTPDATGSGIWMAGGGLAVDVADPVNFPYGRMFVATGNGTFNAMAPYLTYRNFGDDIVRFDLTGGVITPQDSFTVSNQAQLNTIDGDLGSGGVLVLPNSVGSVLHPHLLVQAGKSGTIYLVDRDNMGGYNPTDNIVQEIPAALGPMYSTPAYWNGNVYFYGYGDSLKAFAIANGVMSSTPTSISSSVSSYPGATPSISANGSLDGIVWTLATEGIEGSLQAYSATNVANQLWTSDMNITRDDPGPRSKFSVATIANGQVFVGATNVYVYGSMFTVSAATTRVQAAAGSSGTANLQVASPFGSGYSGNVTLNIPDLPTGVTAVFSSPVVTLGASPASGSSTLTLNVASAMAAGNYVFHVIGSSGNLISSAAMTLQVAGAPPALTPVISPSTGIYQTTQTVSISDLTPAATIYYTIDGSTPTTSSPVYNGSFSVASTTTVQAIAVAPLFGVSAVASSVITVQPPTATPTISPATGTFTTTQTVTITDTTPGATIYFTTNGTTPTTSSPVYNSSFQVSSSTTVQAVAIAPNMTLSAVASSAITIQPPAATPSINPPTATYGAAQTVTITDTTPNATIYYTTNGMPPSTSSPVYAGSFTVSSTTTVLAIATAPGYSISNPASSQITIQLVAATPAITPPTGSYTSSQLVTITDSTPGATIYYTTNASTPTTSSAVYSAPFTVVNQTKIEAIAVASGYAQSPVASSSINMPPPAPAPTFNPPAGTLMMPQTVSLSDSASGATIYYTTNGAYPTTSSPVYSGPIPLAAGATIKAIATASPAYSQSAAATSVYTAASPAAKPVITPSAGTYTSLPVAVTATTTTSGASIYYTTDGSSPTVTSNLYSGPINISSTQTISAAAFAPGMSQSPVAAATFTIPPVTATPVLSAPTGTYAPGPTVTITDMTPNSTIYYTIDGSTPTAGSIKYTTPVTIAGTVVTLQAIAFVPGWQKSAIVSATYTLGQAGTPTFSPGAGTYSPAPSVTITSATTGATIYYTTNGSTPTAGSIKYTGPVAIAASETLQAIALASGYANSAIGSAAYTIGPAATPSISPNPGTYPAGTTVTLTDTIPGAVIYYTTDGSTPTTGSVKYTAPFALNFSKTVNAIAVAAGYTKSATATAAFTIH